MGAALAATSGGLFFILFIVFYVLAVLPLMGIFGKASQPAWAAFVPIYNIIILLKVVGRPWWWLLLFLIPFVGIVFAIIVLLRPVAQLRPWWGLHRRPRLPRVDLPHDPVAGIERVPRPGRHQLRRRVELPAAR